MVEKGNETNKQTNKQTNKNQGIKQKKKIIDGS